MDSQQERRLRLYFDISVIGKGVISAAEIIAGILVFFIPVSVVTNYIIGLAQGDLGELAGDFIANQITHAAQDVSGASATFIAIYLLSRGIIKLALVVALLKNQLWAYPWSLVVLAVFVAYQCYQIAMSHSLAVVLLTIFDLIVMYFIWREYQVLKAHHTISSPQL